MRVFYLFTLPFFQFDFDTIVINILIQIESEGFMSWENYIPNTTVNVDVNTPLGICHLELRLYRYSGEEVVEAVIWKSEKYMGGSYTDFCGSAFFRKTASGYKIIRTKTHPYNNELWLHLERIIANESSVNE